MVRTRNMDAVWVTQVLGMRDETHLRPNLPYDGIAAALLVVSP